MSKRIAEFSPFHADMFDRVLSLGSRESLFREECCAVAGLFEANSDAMSVLLDATHRAQRLIQIGVAGLQDNLQFREAYLQVRHPGWADFHSLLNDQNVWKKKFILASGKDITTDIRFTVEMVDPDFLAMIAEYGGAEVMQRIAVHNYEVACNSKRTLVCYPETQAIMVHPYTRSHEFASTFAVEEVKEDVHLKSSPRRCSALDRMNDTVYRGALDSLREVFNENVSPGKVKSADAKPIAGYRLLQNQLKDHGIEISYWLLKNLAGLTEGASAMNPDLPPEFIDRIRVATVDIARNTSKQSLPERREFKC